MMKTPTITFRKAQLNDAHKLETLINSAYRGDSARGGWTHEADLVEGLRTTCAELSELIGNTNEYFLLSEMDGELIGSVHVKMEEDGLYFGMLAVEPKSQNQKIGAGLMEEVTRLGRESQKKYIRISVIHLRKELIAYYERKGFALTGASESFPVKYPAKIPGLRLDEMKKTL